MGGKVEGLRKRKKRSNSFVFSQACQILCFTHLSQFCLHHRIQSKLCSFPTWISRASFWLRTLRSSYMSATRVTFAHKLKTCLLFPFLTLALFSHEIQDKIQSRNVVHGGFYHLMSSISILFSSEGNLYPLSLHTGSSLLISVKTLTHISAKEPLPQGNVFFFGCEPSL